MNLKINIERLRKNLLEVGDSFNSGSKGYNRLAFSPEEKAALEWLKQKLQKLNISVEQDSIGNVFGKFGDQTKASIAFGSHLDTVIEGGLYDGALGVVVGLECLETLSENGYAPIIPLELIAFVAEEANPLGGTFGSRAVTGMLTHNDVLNEKLESISLTRESCEAARKTSESFESFLELHIEQGSVLEDTPSQIGIVHSIAGILRLGVKIQGSARHAGTTPMIKRKDALVDASKLIHFLNGTVTKFDEQMVVTVGELNVYPNLASVVPGEVHLVIEIRGSDWSKMKAFELAIRTWLNAEVVATIEIDIEKYPNDMDKDIQKVIEEACIEQNVSYVSMVSGANHDSKSMATLTKAGMLFIPSKDGISHHPDEFSSWKDIEIGANVMLQTLIYLSQNKKTKVV